MKYNLLSHYVASMGKVNELSNDAKQKLQGLGFQKEHKTSFQFSQYHQVEERLSMLGVMASLQSSDLSFFLLQRTLLIDFAAKASDSLSSIEMCHS